jgi:hypothetical protein
MVTGVYLGVSESTNADAVLVAILLTTFSSSIFFPILVGYFYEKAKEEESGEAIWEVFRDFSEAGITRVYRDREENQYPDNALVDLRNSFTNHHHGEIRIVGVSLRVFFNSTGPFYEAIRKIAASTQTDPSVRILALISHPESPESLNRAAIETPSKGRAMIGDEIGLSVKSMENLRHEFDGEPVQYGYYNEAPYCTAVIFPDKCYFSPNILSKEVPVRLPMIVFRSDSHACDVLRKYFDYLWSKRMNLEAAKLDPVTSK